MTTDEPRLERQMGCMAGFLHLFDHHHALSPKRYTSPKRLLPSPDTESTSPSERSGTSSALFPTESRRSSAPPKVPTTPALDSKEKPWKLLEGSRLSLDSRAVVDSKGKLQHRSPGAVGRLMGLDAIPEPKPAELRRSSSETRARLDPSYYRFVDVTSFQKAKTQPEKPKTRTDPLLVQKKSMELFPEPRQIGAVALYGEIERRLRIRGIHEPAKDLETLKQVLEAVQLRGLLHSNKNLRVAGASPIVLMKPRTMKPSRPSRRDPPPPPAEKCGGPAVPYRQDQVRSDRSPARYSERSRNERLSSRRAMNNAELRRNPQPIRKISAVRSPVSSPKKVGPGFAAVRSPVNRQRNGCGVSSVTEDDTADAVSECRIGTSPSPYDLQAEYRNGRNILERCDMLLNSIAAISSSEKLAGADDQQPSPVSVLDVDSSFTGDDSSPTPSPQSKRSIDFKDDQSLDLEADRSMLETLNVGSDSENREFVYVAQIVRAWDGYQGQSKLYYLLEKKNHWYDATPFHHRLLFDLVIEILNRFRHVSSYEAFTPSLQDTPQATPKHVWKELQRIRQPVLANDLNDITCIAVCNDMAADPGWTHRSVEISDAVLQIERLIFKDLVADTIRELADVASHSRQAPRRKLVF